MSETPEEGLRRRKNLPRTSTDELSSDPASPGPTRKLADGLPGMPRKPSVPTDAEIADFLDNGRRITPEDDVFAVPSTRKPSIPTDEENSIADNRRKQFFAESTGAFRKKTVDDGPCASPTGAPLVLNEESNILLDSNEDVCDVQAGRRVEEEQDADDGRDSASADNTESIPKAKPLGTWEFIMLELSKGYSLESNPDRYIDKQKKLYAFAQIPIELEKFIMIGFMHCLDAFAHVFTFLPIRIFDIMDSLFWTVSTKRGSGKLYTAIGQWITALVYAILHALLVLLQATTLNVAFNSYNQSLLTIMMSNNFVELKGSVFKKFAKPNLFQMSCSDCRERFHTLILLVVVVLRNLTAVNFSFDQCSEMVPDAMMVILGEFVVDWLKHAFITKFNEINSDVYRDFSMTLAFDVVRSHDEASYCDFSDQVSRRMGFTPIPVAIMLIRVVSQSVDFTNPTHICVFVLLWFGLLVVKILNGVYLQHLSVKHANNFYDLKRQAESEGYRKRLLAAKSKSAPNSRRVSLVDFSDILAQGVAAKTVTASDVLANIRQIHVSSCDSQSTEKSQPPQTPTGEEAPRRSVSMINVSTSRSRRDNSLPPLNEQTGDEQSLKEKEGCKEKDDPPLSPKKRLNVCEELSDVQAFQLLGGDNAQEIRS